MNSEKKDFTIEFVSPMLGTVAKNKDIYAAYIATKAPTHENGSTEIVDIKEVEERGWTGFLCDEKGLYIPDYMIKGTLKNCCKVMQETKDIPKIQAYKTWIDNCVFVTPRKLHVGKTEPDGCIERSLRASTPQGPRISLIRSDMLNPGTKISFTIEVLNNSKGITIELISKLFEYGRYQGLGQWRGSGGYGQFIII